jgi:hypothetical protein
MDENWAFGVYSSLYTEGGAQDRFILHCAFLNQSLRLELYWKFFTHLEGGPSTGSGKARQVLA